MSIFALLTTQRFINDDDVRRSVEDVAKLMHRDIILTNIIASLYDLRVDLIFWLPGFFDEELYQMIQVMCSRIVFLAHVSGRDPQGRMRTGGEVLDRPGLLTLVVPFNVEEVHFLVTKFYYWPAS